MDSTIARLFYRAARRALVRPAAWKLAAAQQLRAAAERAPRALFQPITIMPDERNADPGIAGGLGLMLRAIAAGSQTALDAARGSIMADFANRIAAARATARPQDLPGILRVIKEQRRAALAVAARNAARERAEKRQAVLQSGQAQRPKRSTRPDPHKPG